MHLEMRVLFEIGLADERGALAEQGEPFFRTAIDAAAPHALGAAPRARPPKPRRAEVASDPVPSRAYRHVKNMPSAVSRERSHVRQNGAVVDAMMP